MSDLIRKRQRRNVRPLSIMVEEQYKDLYDHLSQVEKVGVAEHLRRVIYPELERLRDLSKSAS